MFISVKFIYPRKNNKIYRANVKPQLTAREAIIELCSPNTGPFLPPIQKGYDYMLLLSRTNTLISPNSTLGDANVRDDDILTVTLNAMAA